MLAEAGGDYGVMVCVHAYRRYVRLGPLSFDEILSQKVGFMDEPSGAEYGVLVAGESSEYRHVMAVECFTHQLVGTRKLLKYGRAVNDDGCDFQGPNYHYTTSG